MSHDQVNTKKRTYDDHLKLKEVSASYLGQSFRSKADFANYWGTCLQVSIYTHSNPDPTVYSSMFRPSST